MAIKAVAFLATIEYIFIKPYLLPHNDDGTDFIGFGLATAVLAFFGQMYMRGLHPDHMQRALWTGILGGIVAFAWLLFYIPKTDRQIHHLLVLHLAILAGCLFGSWDQRRRARRMYRGGNGRTAEGYGRATGGRGGRGGGGGGSGIRTSKDIDAVSFKMGGCCGMRNGMPVDG